MHRSGIRRPSAGGRGTRAHQGWPHSSHSATACSVQCLVQLHHPRSTSSPPSRPDRCGRARSGRVRTVSRLVECSAGGRAPLIERYALPEIAGLFTDEARFRAWLEVEILATEAWAKLGVVPAADAVAVRERAEFDVAAIHERERTTEHDVAAFVDVVQERIGAPAGVVAPLRAHVERRRRHRALGHARAGGRPRARGRRRARGRHRRPGPRVPRHADGGAHPRRARRAHHLRHEARAVGDAGAPRPRATGPGPARHRGRASSRAQSARTPTSTPRSRPTCARRSGSRPCPRRR